MSQLMYRAVVIDIDGTAVDSPTQKIASPRLAEAAKELTRLGIKICAATGRPLTFARPVLESMGVTEPCILAAGTKIIRPNTGEVIWQCEIPSEAMDQVRVVVDKLGYGCLWDDFSEDDYLGGCWDPQMLSIDQTISFFDICFVPDANAKELATKLEKIEGLNITSVVSQRPGTRDIHVTSRQATKEFALYELEKIIEVDKSNIIGVGDGLNDLHLFSAVGHKVAMGNAAEELKIAADEVIGDVGDDGLAEYFEKLTKEVSV